MSAAMSPWDRLTSGESSIFAGEHTFRTPEYRAYLALDLVKPPAWPAFRDKRLGLTSAPPVEKPLTGHANLPLNLPGSSKYRKPTNLQRA